MMQRWNRRGVLLVLGAALALASGCDGDDTSGGCEPGSAGCVCDGGACAGDLVCDGDSCRAAISCADAGCVANQLCTEAAGGNDAVCLQECETGFVWNATAGACDALPGNCLDGDPASIKPVCDAEDRECVEGGGTASCGACKSGYVEVGGVCEKAADCASLDCGGTLNRECDGTANPPLCTTCLPDFIEDPPNAACRALVTCADLTCADCVEHTAAADAYCPVADVCAAPPSCPSGEAWQQLGATGQCLACPACAANAAQTGNLYPVISEEGSCVCETNDGYFFSDASDGVEPCDEDADGWTRITARQALRSTDCAVANNARCQLRTIDRFVLHADEGVSFDVPLADDLFTKDLPEITGNGGLLDLYETVANDTYSARGPAPLTPPFEPYANGDLDPSVYPTRAVAANEVNSLTKGCTVSSLSTKLDEDFNDNGEADITEWQGMSALTVTPEWQKPFVHFSFFIELHDSWYEGPEGGTGGVGAYHIREKSRAAGGVPFRYGAGQGSYWTACYRRQDSSYAVDGSGGPSDAAPNRGMDFARFPARDASAGRMGHHSQFKCARIVSSHSAPTDPRLHPEEVLLSDVPGNWVVNACNMEPGTTLTQPGPGVDPANPYSPSITCRRVSSPTVGVALVAPLFTDYAATDGYARGCINECVDQALLPDATGGSAPGYQCPGYGTPGAQCNYDAADFGALQCVCDDNHAGVDCSAGCAPSHVSIDDAYRIGTQDPGEFWVCGHVTSSAGPPVLADAARMWEVRGHVTRTGTGRVLMCETPPCEPAASGLTVW